MRMSFLTNVPVNLQLLAYRDKSAYGINKMDEIKASRGGALFTPTT